MLARAEGRAHHVSRRRREVGVAIDAVIDQEMPRQHLAEDALAFAAGARDRLHCLAAGIVHDIERHAQHLRQADGAVRRLALDRRRTRQRMALRTGDAGLDELLLQMKDELAVLGMDGAKRAQLARPEEAFHQDLVIRHDGVLVGHEMLEAVDAVLADERSHVLGHALVPPGDGDVEAVIGRGFLRPAPPFAIGLEQVLLGARDDEIDDHRRAARRRRRGAGEKILRRHRPHEG